MTRTPKRHDAAQVRRLSDTTIAYYDRVAEAFWEGTRHHDVSQNCGAFLDAIQGDPPYSILDLGCGAGRDLSYFQSLGHEAVGLDGSRQFVIMARSHSQCEVLHQDFLAMRLPEGSFDGIFANASLFHVPSQELPRVLLELCKSLKAHGVLFSSNPQTREGITRRASATGGMSVSSISILGAITSPRPALWRWTITTARRDCRGTSSRGLRPSGAKVNPRDHPPVRCAMSKFLFRHARAVASATGN
jgi:SAM-dependent methyltransferase